MNNKYKILLVEDDENIRIMVGAMLESAGYQVIETRSCSTAITLAVSHIPDLILLDLGLPDMDGMKLLEDVRKTDLTPIIILSARSDEAEKVKAAGLTNVKFVRGDANLLGEFDTVSRCDRIYINYCDPWHPKVMAFLNLKEY